MAKIKPFKAVIYNQQKIKDLWKMVCPPYDVISASQQQRYHEISPYNFIHILLGKDSPNQDKYKRAAVYFQDWQKNEILIEDKNPAIYFYTQQYNLKGEKKMRFGFMACLRLGDRSDKIFGHEHTHTLAKEDRFNLLTQVKANLSPIFVVFPDTNRIIARLREKYIPNQQPFIDIVDEEKTVHKIWRIDSPEIIKSIQDKTAGENIFIADGHHRYEVACAYKEEMAKKAGIITGEESFNYILAYFTNTDSHSLTILPIHRLVKLDSKLNMENFTNLAAEYFDIEEVKDRTRFFFLMSKASGSEHILGMYTQGKYWFLRLRNIKILDKIITGKPPEYKRLGVAILNYIVFKKILRFDLDDKERIRFIPEAGELIAQVDSNIGCAAFFLNPVRIEQMMSIALNGEKMPPKSTYFYPKVLSGMVINKFEE